MNETDGVGKVFRDSRFGLLVHAAITAVVAIGLQLFTDLQTEASSVIGVLAGLASGWLTAKRTKRLG